MMILKKYLQKKLYGNKLSLPTVAKYIVNIIIMIIAIPAMSQITVDELLKKIQLKPHKTVNIQNFLTQYEKNKEIWNKAFYFISKNDLENMEPGIYEIDGNKCFATISEYETKKNQDAKIEAHKKYIDFHYVITGREKIGIVPSKYLQSKIPYNEKKDVTIYSSPFVEYFPTSQNRFFLFFPGEAHCPGMKIKDVKTVKKVVIKILYAQS